MREPDDMDPLDAPATKRDLVELATKQDLVKLRQELKREFEKYVTKDELEQELKLALANYPTKDELKQELKLALANYPTKDELTDRLSTFATLILQEVKSDMASLGTQLSAELASHAKAIAESVASQIGVVDQKYADLPGRVATLERAAIKRTRRRPPTSR